MSGSCAGAPCAECARHFAPPRFRRVWGEQYQAFGRVPLGVFWQTMHLSALKATKDGTSSQPEPRNAQEASANCRPWRLVVGQAYWSRRAFSPTSAAALPRLALTV